MIRLVLVIALLAACGGGDADRGPARMTYNDALAALEAGELDTAIEALVSARDQAGQDPELRYRAAFNLGLAFAKKAEAVETDNPEEAAEHLRRSAGWFRDAASLRPDDPDAAINLELVLARLQVLADRINHGQNGLEARLERLITDQRGLRDQVRQLLDAIDEAGAAAEPVAFQEQFEAAATTERALAADASTVADLAAEERAGIEAVREEERDDDARMRLVQLGQLEQHLQRARAAMAEARRALRELRGDPAHRRADAGLAALKRAREQLMEPIAVLGQIAGDEQRLAADTAGLVAETGVDLEQSESPAAPAWLTSEHLSERQAAIEDRLAEILARLRAGVDAGGGSPDTASDPRQQHLLAAAADALPHLAAADQAMLGAREALDGDRPGPALEREREALEALARAIERFAGVKQLIELTWADQRGLVDLLTPADELPEDSPLAELDTAERTRRIDELVGSNRDRLARLEGALAAERATAVEQAGQGADPSTEEGQQAVAQAGQVYDRAEELRLEAAAALEQAADILASNARWQPGQGPLPPARQTLEHLDELRRLFFTIVEHLKQLLRDQADTHDHTATAHQLLDDERPELLGPASSAQDQHAALADSLAQALEQQADQAGQASEPEAADAAQRLADAAVEVRAGSGRMFDAAAALTEALAAIEQASYDLGPALEDQKQAMAHLEAAIRILEPPQEQPQDQQQQEQQQQEQQQEQEQEQMSRDEAQRRLQAIRDREAERDRERRRRQQAAPEPVEKDW